VIAELIIERNPMSLQTRWQQLLKPMFKTFKMLKVTLLAILFLIVSNIIVNPAPAQAGNFNFDGSVIEINQEFVGYNNQNKDDIDDVDILIGVIIGSTLIVLGSAYFIGSSVSHITKLIQGQVPEKTSELSNANAASTAALVESNN
jgi:hypothetical protein